jgi:outer membrane protein TolC
MQILIKLIHFLNGQLEQIGSNSVPTQFRPKIRTICAVLALSLGGIGSIETVAQARTLDRAGIRSSLIANSDRATNQSNSTQPQFSNPIAQRTENTTPPPPASPRLNNNLDLPKAGDRLRITNNQSLTLQQAIDIAERNNRDVQAARLSVDRSQGAVSEAEAAKAIRVGVTGTVQNQGAPVLTGLGANQRSTSTIDAQGALSANYNLLTSGRDDAQIRAAQEQVKFDQLDLQRVQLKLKSDVIGAYYDLQQADSAVIIGQAAVQDATRSLSDAQLQEKAGVGTKFDILRAQVQLATANQDLVTAQGQQRIARKRVAQLLSVDENTEFKAADPVSEAGKWTYSLEDSIIIAYRNRPEISQQLVRRNISKEQESVASAANGAQVSVFANYNMAQNFSNSTSLQDGYNLGAQLRWDFWDGGAGNARSYQQKVSQEIAENQFTSTRNQVRFEVEQSYNNLLTNQKNIATATTALKQAEESLKLARLRFQAGVGTQTDVIQAQTELARARGNRIRAILDYNRSLSNLRTATVVQ